MYFPGVVWQINQPIKGGFETLAMLQKLGKKIYLVTNNSENTDQTYCDRAQSACLYLNPVSRQCVFLNFIGLSDDYFVYVYAEFISTSLPLLLQISLFKKIIYDLHKVIKVLPKYQKQIFKTYMLIFNLFLHL